jgi:hypothetical protein
MERYRGTDVVGPGERSLLRVQQLFGDLLHPGDGDPGALLDGERMVRVLKFDHRPLADGLGMDVGLEGQRRRLVARDLGAQPAEVRRASDAPASVRGSSDTETRNKNSASS